MPPWFVYINGFAMLILGVAMILTRPHPTGASFYKRFVNFGTLWACLCVAVGVTLLAMALGYLRFGQPAAQPRPRSHWQG